METDNISAVRIDKNGCLQVAPSTSKFPCIYREAGGVNWDAELECLYTPTPRDWSYLAWFFAVLEAGRTQGVLLELTERTVWHNVPRELREEILRETARRERLNQSTH